jgi:Bacteriophage tail sheath protein
MAPYRSPGVYLQEAAERRFVRLEAVPMNVTAFLGIAQRGPLYTPRRITSFTEFKDVYGAFVPYGYLAHAVFGFFANGGRECHVVRIAHLPADEGADGAARATLATKARSGADLLALTASSEGTWGNRVKVDVGEPKRPTSTLLTQDVAPGSSSARVRSTRGFGPGDVVELRDGSATQFMVLTEISGDELKWSAEHPARSRFSAVSPTRVTAVEFRMTLAFESQLEEFDHLSSDPRSERYFVKVVGGGSRLVTVADRRLQPDVFDPPLPVAAALTGGRDGLATLTADDFVGFDEGPGRRRGLAALDEIDEIGLLAVPDVMAARHLSPRFTEGDVRVVQDALVGHCERRKDRFAILDAPEACDIEQIREWRRHFDSKYAALYYPWAKVLLAGDAAGAVRAIPPSGHVAGVYARCDRERGIHKAPANEVLEEVVGLETFLSLETQGLLNHEQINCLRAFPARGIRIWGARTLSSDASWRYVNVRRLITMIERAIEEGTQWAVFEGNEPTLWKQVIRSVAGFLRELARQGYLVGETDEEAFYVKCDEETNPPEVVDAGQLVCEIGVAAVRPAEFIVFRIGQRTEEPIIE